MPNRFYLSLVLIVLLCLAGWTGYAQGQRSNPTRQAWEYVMVDAFNDPGQAQRVLNQYGAQAGSMQGPREIIMFSNAPNKFR